MQDNNAQKGEQGGLSWSTPAKQTTPNAAPQKPAVTPVKAPTSAPVAASTGSSVGKYIGMIVAGVLAGVVLAWGYAAWRTPSAGTQTTATSGTTTSSKPANTTDTKSTLGVDTATVALGSDPSLLIMSPQPAGTSVAISKAIVSEPTWVVVYENKDGKPGNALGATLFFPERQAGTVELLRATSAGKSYLAVKQVDNGDRKFSLRGDQYLSEGGEVQWVTFEVR